MSGGEAARDLRPDAHHHRRGQRSVAEALAQRAAADELHDDEGRLADADVVHHDEVGMGERRDRARFEFETAQPVRVRRNRRRQDLDRHFASEPRVARPIDLAHAARAERREDFVGPQAKAGSERAWKSASSIRRAPESAFDTLRGRRGARRLTVVLEVRTRKLLGSPDDIPLRSHSTRCGDEPWVKDSGCT